MCPLSNSTENIRCARLCALDPPIRFSHLRPRISVVAYPAMNRFPAAVELRARDLVACAVACLLLVQAWASFVPTTRQALLQDSGPGIAALLSGSLCHEHVHDGEDRPAQDRHHHQHCVLCGVGLRDLALPVVTLAAIILHLATPRFDAGPAWSRADCGGAPPPLGWLSSWSSRAPPSFS